ncbi:MAG: sterol desaturase family protein [Acidobacteria bacterium]|nr:sterol desaturase family protein [Acidobacteriota bacterium]
MKITPEQYPTLIAAFCLALLLALESWAPAASARHHRFLHAVRNLTLGLLNAAGSALLAAPLIAGIGLWAESKSFGLLRLVQLPPATATVAAIVLFDGWMYLWHRANHKIGFLWRFHRVHHSDPEMDATTATRFHTGEILISSALRLAVIPLLGITVGQLLVYEMLLLPVILFHHSNVQFPEKMDRWLRLLIVTPALHRVHHSRLRDETDSNYSSVFSFWDRIAKTLRLRWDGQPVNFGLNEFGATRWERLPSLLIMPFVSLKQQAEVTEKDREKIPAKLPKSSPPAGGA